MNQEDQELLALAHAAIRDSQRRLHALSEDGRLRYHERLNEWEQCRHSLEQLAAESNSRRHGAKARGRTSNPKNLLEDDVRLRERNAELAEKVYRLQQVLRLLAGTIRHLEKESARLRPGADNFLKTRDGGGIEDDAHDRIIHAYEQERLRLAREIHDGPAQILANAIFELEYFEKLFDRDPTSVKQELAKLKSDLRVGLTEVRRFLFDLRPPSLSDMGLFVALRQYVADFEKHFGIHVEAELHHTTQRLSPTKEVALFRIVQEALQNVQKHAGASSIAVRAKMDRVTLKLSIEDNGRGFDLTEVASRPSRNLGLISMRERAELIDGQLQITTSPGAGTTITVVTPLEDSSS